MTPQHLSDEAVAAFADGVLRGHARERATRHVEACPECAEAVRGQREAAYALRSAPLPCVPSPLADRLRSVPMTTPLTSLPTAIDADGTTVLATFAAGGTFAGLVPSPTPARTGRSRTLLLGVAVVALAGGAMAASAAVADSGSGVPAHPAPAATHAVHQVHRTLPAHP